MIRVPYDVPLSTRRQGIIGVLVWTCVYAFALYDRFIYVTDGLLCGSDAPQPSFGFQLFAK